MNLLLVSDGHYIQTSDGQVFSESVYNYSFFKRYLCVFDHVYAVVRLTYSDEGFIIGNLCSGDGVSFLPLPAFKGPWEYIKKKKQLTNIVRQYCKNYNCAIFRLPGATSNLICKEYEKTGKPFAIEVVIDPWENFAPKAIKNFLRPIIRISWTLLLKRMCRKANGVSYVTEYYLQKKYPSAVSRGGNPTKYFESFYSSVELPDDSFASPKCIKDKESYRIIHVSNSYTGYGKGHIVLMKAIKQVLNDGYHVDLDLVGDGPLRPTFEAYAESLGISNHIRFHGRLADSAAVRQIMRQSDLFVFPTLAEGLPRVLLEAMAEGLPCISTPVCGIPEILDDEFLCDYYDYIQLSILIERFISSPELMQSEGEKNLNTAKNYASSVLSSRRKNFYMKLKAQCNI